MECCASRRACMSLFAGLSRPPLAGALGRFSCVYAVEEQIADRTRWPPLSLLCSGALFVSLFQLPMKEEPGRYTSSCQRHILSRAPALDSSTASITQTLTRCAYSHIYSSTSCCCSCLPPAFYISLWPVGSLFLLFRAEPYLLTSLSLYISCPLSFLDAVTLFRSQVWKRVLGRYQSNLESHVRLD
jgi:hypothetical protein